MGPNSARLVLQFAHTQPMYVRIHESPPNAHAHANQTQHTDEAKQQQQQRQISEAHKYC